MVGRLHKLTMENGTKDDTLSLMYYMNVKANVIVKTPFRDTDSTHLARTVLGPMLNNCSLDRVCKEGYSYHLGSVEIRPMEFADDIADPNSDEVSAKFSNGNCWADTIWEMPNTVICKMWTIKS